MKPAAVLSAQAGHCTHRRHDQRRSFVARQRRGRDAEEAQLRSKNRLFLELVVTEYDRRG